MDSSSQKLTFFEFIALVSCYLFCVSCELLLFHKLWLSKKLELHDAGESRDEERDPTVTAEDIYRILEYVRKALERFDFLVLKSHIGLEGYAYLAFLRKMKQAMSVLSVVQLSMWIPYYCIVCESGSSFFLIDLEKHQTITTINALLCVLVVVTSLQDLARLLDLKSTHATPLTGKEYAKNQMFERTILVNVEKQEGREEEYSRKQFYESFKQNLREDLGLQIVESRQQHNFSRFRESDQNTSANVLQYKFVKFDLNLGKLADMYRDLEMRRKNLGNVPSVFKMFPCIYGYDSHSLREAEDELTSSLARWHEQAIVGAPLQRTTYERTVKKFEDLFEYKLEHPTFNGMFVSLKSYRLARDLVGRTQWKPHEINGRVYMFRWAQDPNQIFFENVSEWSKNSFINFVLHNLLAAFLVFMVSTPFSVVHYLGIENNNLIVPVLVPLTNSVMVVLLKRLLSNQPFLTSYEKEHNLIVWISIYSAMVIIGVPVFKAVYGLVDLFEGPLKFFELTGLLFRVVDPPVTFLLVVSQINSNFYNMCCLGELYWAYFSKELALDMRRQRTRGNFEFGHNYTQVIIVGLLVLMYSPVMPLLPLFGLAYFLTRLWVDSFLLLWQGNEKFETRGKLEKFAHKSIMFGCSVWLLLLGNFFLEANSYMCVAIIYGTAAYCLVQAELVWGGKEEDLLDDKYCTQFRNTWKDYYRAGEIEEKQRIQAVIEQMKLDKRF